MKYFVQILRNVLLSLYVNFGAAVLFTVLLLFVFVCTEEFGILPIAKKLVNKMKTESRYRVIAALFFYISMILFRTLLCRNIWESPLHNVIGVWSFHDSEGNLYTENIENFILFLPFAYLVLLSGRKKIFRTNPITFLRCVLKGLDVSFAFSLFIEFSQLFLKVGTFQVSDLFFNTLGGIAGSIVFWLYEKIIVEKKNTDLSNP